ncbi:MAG: CBS domain-containing protein [Treponema sp.]|jgi:CBS domain-containing protein|nr:CBS domain-containing protein [Treponema sp.]
METIPLNTEMPSDAVNELLFKLKVRDVMTAPITTASPEDSMRALQILMKTGNFTGVPIAKDGRLLGMVSMQDVINAFDGGWIDESAERHMTRSVIVLQDSMPVSFCVTYFNKYHFGRFPVLDADMRLVGIVTQYDVITALLEAMNVELEKLEKAAHEKEKQKAKSAEPAPGQAQVIEFKTESFNFDTAGKASTEIKKILKARNIDPALTRRVGIASYELEINQVVHSSGGVMRYFLEPDKLVIEALDTGPGIADVAKALTQGFSTATERVRALGFGAGMGLPNIIRVSDDFDIQSKLGEGTVVHSVFYLDGRGKRNDKEAAV